MQIDGEGIENLLMNMVEKRTLKIQKFGKTHFQVSLFENELNKL